MLKDILEVTRLFNPCPICSAGLRKSGKIGTAKFPRVILAFAVVVDEDVPVREVYEFILSHKKDGKCSEPSIIEDAQLFDIYRGRPLDNGKKSLAFNVHYRRNDRTLTEREANLIHEKIAGKMNCSQVAVRSKLARARKSFRKVFEKIIRETSGSHEVMP